MRLLVFCLTFIPKNMFSYVVGVLVRIELPKVLQVCVNNIFVRFAKINMTEAQKPLKEYSSLEELFTRKLRKNVRTFAGRVCSPCDGILQASHRIHDQNQVMQAKGMYYSVTELILGKKGQTIPGFNPGWYSNIYLSPKHYHRVHCPIDAYLKSITHIRGDLWPVNLAFVKHVPNLFTRNERVVFELETSQGGLVYVVMVGALNVGRIETVCGTSLVSNTPCEGRKEKVRKIMMEEKTRVRQGDELGVFRLGSTTIVVFDESVVNESPLKDVKEVTSVLLGESLEV